MATYNYFMLEIFSTRHFNLDWQYGEMVIAGKLFNIEIEIVLL